MADPLKPPPGQCPQCWQHAYDKSIHRKLKPGEDCPGCIQHLELHRNERRIQWW